MEPFFKYHGLGNDFVVLDRRKTARDIDESVSRLLCDRRRGIGADGVLVLLPPTSASAVAQMVVHNADGSVAEMCGNGLRCVVRYLAEHDGSKNHPVSVTVDTGAGTLSSDVEWAPSGVERITVAMGPALVEFRDEAVQGFIGTSVNMGNPHFVLLGNGPEQAPLIGPKLEVDRRFPARTNVECCQREPGGHLTVTVWERGVGITQACGTGACAAVVASALAGHSAFDSWVKVSLPGGVLEVNAKRDLSMVQLRGPAAFVYQGNLP